jgi:5-methyltetrahydrofolate--homocysteine methyltransferase
MGVDIPAQKFVEEIKKNNLKLVGLSALLTTTMPVMKDVIDELATGSETTGAKVMVGGTPLTLEYTDSIGAAGYTPDASSAVDLAGKLL